MPGNPSCTLYIGNLDEKVNERVLYEILIQAGRIVDMYIPRDKETNRHKGFAFTEYETEEIAEYAVKLFSGLVSLHKKTLKFAISGQDKPTPNSVPPVTPVSNSSPLSRTPHEQSPQILTPCRFSAYPQNTSPNFPQASSPVLVGNGYRSESSYSGSYDYSASSYDYNSQRGRFLGGSRPGLVPPPYNSRQPIAYPSY